MEGGIIMELPLIIVIVLALVIGVVSGYSIKKKK